MGSFYQGIGSEIAQQKDPHFADLSYGRDSKTALELTVSIVALLENYIKVNTRLREVIAWKPTIKAFAVAL